MHKSIKQTKWLLLALFCLVGIATAEIHSIASYSNSVTGSLNAPAPDVVNPIYLDLQVTGDTPGSFKTSIQYNNTKDIVAGEWTHTTIKQNDDGTSTVVGTLTGTFDGGKVVFNEDSTIASVNNATFVIKSGTGAYSGIASGDGNLNGNFNNSPTFPFNGTLSFNF